MCFPLVLLVACDETTQTVSAPRIAKKSPNVEVCDCQDCEPRKTRVLTRYVLRAETFSVREMRLHTDAHDLARGSPPPLPANMSALARTTASALRAPRLAGALRGGKRCAAIETTAPDSLFRRPRVQFRFFYVPKRRSTRRRGHEARAS